MCGEELSGAACSIVEGHNKIERKKSTILCITLQNRVEKIFLHVCIVESKIDSRDHTEIPCT